MFIFYFLHCLKNYDFFVLNKFWCGGEGWASIGGGLEKLGC